MCEGWGDNKTFTHSCLRSNCIGRVEEPLWGRGRVDRDIDGRDCSEAVVVSQAEKRRVNSLICITMCASIPLTVLFCSR